MDPGRNAPCHCGSERKYKKCCLNTDQEIARGERPVFTIDGSNSPKVEDGHIVPRMYQKAWEVKGRRVAVHVDGTEVCEVKSTKLVATRGPYYCRTRPKGDQTDDTEDSLSRIENKAAAPLRQLVAGQPLEAERKGIVAQLLAVQIMRGPAFFAQREEIVRPPLEAATAKDFQPQALASVGGDVDMVRQEAIAAELDPTKQFITMLAYARKIASVLGLMRWQLLHFDAPVLAYSDHPVVLWPLNAPSSQPFRRQGLGPSGTLEIRVPIAPNAAILMNWLDLSDEVGVQMPTSVAAELNAFTISQAETEWMHQPGSEPEVGNGVFEPLSRLIDPSYGKQTVLRSTRHALAAQFF
ncbi:MAG TPA: DUF4238 domain-containing protein [Candidatus Dormibacteraeota bacterium]